MSTRHNSTSLCKDPLRCVPPLITLGSQLSITYSRDTHIAPWWQEHLSAFATSAPRSLYPSACAQPRRTLTREHSASVALMHISTSRPSPPLQPAAEHSCLRRRSASTGSNLAAVSSVRILKAWAVVMHLTHFWMVTRIFDVDEDAAPGASSSSSDEEEEGS